MRSGVSMRGFVWCMLVKWHNMMRERRERVLYTLKAHSVHEVESKEVALLVASVARTQARRNPPDHPKRISVLFWGYRGQFWRLV